MSQSQHKECFGTMFPDDLHLKNNVPNKGKVFTVLMKEITGAVLHVRSDRTLKADRMEVYFSEDLKEIKDLICIGNVEILQGENRTFAQRAVYKSDQNKLVLTGRPKLILLTEGSDGTASFRD